MTAKTSLPEPLTDQEWRQDAACVGHDPELWFPPDGDQEVTGMAVRICAGCPVRRQCLAWSIQVDDHYAILGGLTKRQRTALKKRITRWKNSALRNMAGLIQHGA